MGIAEQVHEMKRIAAGAASIPAERKDRALEAVARALEERREEICKANRADLARAEAEGARRATLGRLTFDQKKLEACAEGLRQLTALPDPVGRESLVREMDEGLLLRRVSVPIGVIGVIFEARPDALVQIAGLCIKSGNCAVLKGGREAAETNRVLFETIREAAEGAGIPRGYLLQVSAHEEIDELLTLDGDVDLIIPRGSNAFVRYIMDHTRIPVMGHADGICHIYVDVAAHQEMAVSVIQDAKTQYPAACNAVETVLVHRDLSHAFLPVLAEALGAAGVKLHGDAETAAIIPVEGDLLVGEDYRREYGDLELALRVVADVEEAADHIGRYGSHHTDAIVTGDDAAADRFFALVDSAGVYRNCSTRFADGFRYGFGAEVGISTGKLHARGPVGLEGLVSYRYEIRGGGHIVRDYVEGKRQFHFRDRDRT